jgi:hypothetical protein
MRTLEELKQDITAREAGRIKNAYMKKLGFWAAIGVVLLDAAWGLLRWIGVGVWPKTSQCSKSVPCLAVGYH